MTNEEAIAYLERADTTVYAESKTRTAEALEMAIEALKERKTGKWIAEEIGLRRYATKCSVCGTILHEGYNFENAQEYTKYIDEHGSLDKFCHECGAKMEVEHDGQ